MLTVVPVFEIVSLSEPPVSVRLDAEFVINLPPPVGVYVPPTIFKLPALTSVIAPEPITLTILFEPLVKVV